MKDKIRRLLVNDEHVQRVLPDYPANQREFVISGYCPKCQKKLFMDDEAKYVEGRWFNADMLGGLDTEG